MLNRILLALGADIKSRFLIAKGENLYFGPDIGDLSDAENFERFKKEIICSIKRLRAKPKIIACDLHPGYFSTRFARENNLQLLFAARGRSYKLQLIQHHHAHIASVLAEYGIKRPVIGVSFDGTGYGSDGNMWGGEFLMVKGAEFKRLGHLKYRMMPGGDKVVSEPWRMVLSILGEKGAHFISGVSKKDKDIILSMMSKDINSPLSSSAGRLFDACAALLGICKFASHEAEGPIKLEGMCEGQIEQRYEFKILSSNGCYIVDTDGLFLGMARDIEEGRDKRFIATRFHNSVVEIIVNMVKRLSKKLGIKDVALSGGVFQNKFLKTRVIERLADSDLKLFTNNKTPVNDLNISLGQYYVAKACSP